MSSKFKVQSQYKKRDTEGTEIYTEITEKTCRNKNAYVSSTPQLRMNDGVRF